MIVVADTSPLSCLIQIGWESLLPKLYKSIVIPPGVLLELAHPSAPSEVQSWLQQIPPWVAVEKAPLWPDGSLAYLGPGEREAIQIAQEKHADLLLIDERKGSMEAQRRGLAVTGTLGVLIAAGELGFLDPRAAYRQLIRQTTFRSSAQLEARFMVLTNASLKTSFTSTAQKTAEAPMTRPDLIVHCDWSIDKSRRWMSKAHLTEGKYYAAAPEPVGNLNDQNQKEEAFLNRIQGERAGASALIGFDFPIGLPRRFADRRDIEDFASFLKNLTPDSPFFKVCKFKSDISLERPFYPHAPGEKKLEHLTRALDIERASLFRRCDQAQENRTEAAPLFWTLGAKQVGKAAIVGWRDVLAPALRSQQIQIWPFDGQLKSLLQPGRTVITETYPAQYYSAIFGSLQGAKKDREVRAEAGSRILEWAENRTHLLELDPELRSAIEHGFPRGKDDSFDAVIGLFGMIDAIQTWDARHEPSDPTIQKIEGWILGQSIP